MAVPTLVEAKVKKTTPHAATKQTPSLAHAVYEPDGSFGFCLTDTAYPDGKKLTIAYSPSKQINIGITIPQGKFKIGSRYDLTIKLDKGAERKVRAATLDEETLLLQMGSNVSFRKKLAEAKILYIGSPSNTVSFGLPAIAARIKDLESCIQTKANTKDERAAKAEQMMPEPLKAILITAGFKDIVPISMKDIPPDERPADFLWQMGNILSGVRERAVPTDKSLSDMVGLHIQGLKKHCPGHFNAQIGREKPTPTLTLRTAEARCSPKNTSANDEDVFVSLLFYRTQAGAFTVFTFEGSTAHKRESKADRDQLLKTLLTMAKN
ncbi:MAG: hypothetical protein PHD48_04685 [Alphaproteobacteria bacterium]|nr:hypothetical protein [Alphaproteobacteria bacterium]